MHIIWKWWPRLQRSDNSETLASINPLSAVDNRTLNNATPSKDIVVQVPVFFFGLIVQNANELQPLRHKIWFLSSITKVPIRWDRIGSSAGFYPTSSHSGWTVSRFSISWKIINIPDELLPHIHGYCTLANR